ncbi:polysaccharide deacetylase family protein [Clostridium sp. FP1]|uniref:polysaccharide deacetylase family protein n=1 Tax=Clostridium sp. FP1 TaxID=2724076 RepID=UPI00192D6F0C|nr:polysaccharide deacetylase family protein [Clostridium sp. FP1]MBZ9633215.1 polysaccharide deacetylase family protein [Clostridium sp. FP1]
MKLIKKNSIIIFIVVAGMLINWQVLNKNTGATESSTKTTVHNPPSLRVIYCSPNRTLKQVALTFDDGPDVYYTPQILEILKQNNVKATFFIVGLRAQAHPEMILRIVSEGHSIGNHTWDHPILSRLPADKIKEEVQKTEQLLYKITGLNTAMFRPPYGSTTPQVIDEISSLGYEIIDWSVDTRDWDKTSVLQIMNYVSKELYPGGIILQHCAVGKSGDLSNTVKALPQIISSLRSQGYSFVMVQDLLNIAAFKK